MGYESRIFVGEKYFDEITKRVYFFEIAKVNMAKCTQEFLSLFKKETECIVFESYRDEAITTDCYGDKLKEADAEDVLKWLSNERFECLENNKEWYRRYAMLYGMLNETIGKFDNLVCIHYGY